MKTKITESRYGLNINLIPENNEETALLLRYTCNAKAVKPNVNFNFSQELNCNIHLKKRNVDGSQIININPGLK